MGSRSRLKPNPSHPPFPPLPSPLLPLPPSPSTPFFFHNAPSTTTTTTMSSFSSLLKTSPFLSFTLTLYFLAAASSFLRLAGSLSFSEDPSASRRMERSGQSVLESKGVKEGGAKGSGIASLWPENRLKSGKENRWKVSSTVPSFRSFSFRS